MTHLGRYLRTHLATSDAEIDLFDRAAKGLPEPWAAEVRRIHGQLVGERADLRAMMKALGIRKNPVLGTLARSAERVGRLKPNGDLLHRTAMTDLVELEAMAVTLAARLARWESLRAIADDEPTLDPVELGRLVKQARAQRKSLGKMHTAAARRALRPAHEGAGR